MNWRAIGIAVMVGLGGSLILGVLWRVFPLSTEHVPLWAIMAMSYGLGAILDLATGAVAGALARVRGALHGLTAGAITSVLSPLIGLTMMLVEGRGTLPVPLLDYALAIAGSTVVGIVLATIAGAIAAPIASRHAPASVAE
jgi:hypothetical protein